MKIIIADDETTALNGLTAAVSKVAPEAEIRSFSGSREALEFARSNPPDVAFLDIEMPEINGIELAKAFQSINPAVNIIFTTGYTQYSLDAIQMHASGYLIKPVTAADISEEINKLRNPVKENEDGRAQKVLRVKCFGSFDVFDMDGSPLRFKRSKSKELLAVLVDAEGAAMNTAQICAVMYEDGEDMASQHAMFRVLMSVLRRTLAEAGASDALIVSHNSFAVNPEKLECDFYKWTANHNARGVNPYNDYMSQYSWAEVRAESIRRTLAQDSK